MSWENKKEWDTTNGEKIFSSDLNRIEDKIEDLHINKTNKFFVTNTTERDNLTLQEEGDICYVLNENELYVWDDNNSLWLLVIDEDNYTPISHVGSKGSNQHDLATDTEAGFMSDSDKEKLDTVEENANYYEIDNLTDIPTRNHNDLQNIGNNDHINNIIDIPNRDYKDLNSRGHGNEDHTSTFIDIEDIKIEHDTVASNTERFTGGSSSISELDWVELEKIDVTNKYLGSMRLGVRFRLNVFEGTNTAYVRLKVDGNVVGSWSTSSETYVERTVDIDYSDFNPTVILEGKVESDDGSCQVEYWGVWFDDLSDDDRYTLT